MSLKARAPRAAVDALLAALDPLSLRARMRALAAWTRDRAREESAPGGTRALLEELDTRGAYGRRLAVVAACVARDAGFLEARLAHRDAFVRGHALRAAAHLPIGDDALRRALDDAPAAVRRQVLATIAAGGRTTLAERLLGPVRETWGDEEAARLLRGCGTATVARELPDLFTAVRQWRALARRHPGPVLDEAARQLAGLPPQARTAWWERNAGILAACADMRPQRVLDLLEEHSPPRLPGPLHPCLGRLLTAAPGRTLRLITSPDRSDASAALPLSRSALDRLARSAPPELAALGRAWAARPDALARLLRALPPSRREAFHDAATAGRAPDHDGFDTALLDVLPRRRAHAEARRAAARAEARGAAWHTVLAAVAHLPAAEARPALLAAARRPAAGDRALAYPLLVRNAARSGEPSAVATLLTDLERLRNEQDPVRSPALTALAAVPPTLFTAADAAALDRITVDAVEARDSSARTRRALSTLALRMLRAHAATGEQPLLDWALTTLTRLSGRTGGADLGRLDATLRRGQEFQVLAALRPRVEAGAARADHGLTFALARSLGRRAHAMPELQDLLWRAVRTGNDATVRQAVELWLDPPATRDERVARVLEREPSAAVLPCVLRVLTRRRTDLLDVVLGDTPPYGRFLAAGARWLPPVDAAGHWLPRQQAAAARLLARAAADASLPTAERARCVRAVAAVPEAGRDVVRRHAGSPDTVLAEAALAALAWTDAPGENLPLLLARTGDDRARVAIHAATRASRYAEPSRLAAALRTALLPAADGTPPPGAKVTSRKELVRLAAAGLPVAAAASLLAEVSGLPGQHPDVRAASVSAATALLPAPAAWQLLEDAADGPPVLRGAVLRVRPYDLRPADRPRYARLVGRVARADDPETADTAAGRLARWSPWYPQAAALLTERTVDLADRTSWRVSAGGLVALAADEDGAGPLLEALRRLVAADARAVGLGHDAADDRDRPARQRVAYLVTRLSRTAGARAPGHHRTAALRAAELLCAEADFLSLGARLTVQALDAGTGPEPLLAGLRRLAGLLADRPDVAVRTADVLRQRLTGAASPGDPEALLGTVDRLVAHGGRTAGLFAAAITVAAGPRTGWLPAWRTRVRMLRASPHAEVREAALNAWTAEE